MTVIRPGTSFDGASHTYSIEGWDDEDVVGVSTAAKIGGAMEAFEIASAWGFRVGYEGANAVYGDENQSVYTDDDLRAELQKRGLTPWGQRDKAAGRGTWVHDVLEALAQDNRIPQLSEFPEGEVQGHVKALLAWYVDYRPSFVATEVQVASKMYGFAGRYDIRCKIPAHKLSLGLEPYPFGRDVLCLVDLKTSKGVYPTTYFPQLAGYELASVEMGFPATDAQFVLNTHPDGTYEFKQGWAEPGCFIDFVHALRSIKRLVAADPAEKLKKEQEKQLLAALEDEGPLLSREIIQYAGLCRGLDAKAVGRILGGMRRRGLVEQDERKRWRLAQ